MNALRIFASTALATLAMGASLTAQAAPTAQAPSGPSPAVGKALLVDTSLPCPGPDCGIEDYGVSQDPPGVAHAQGLRVVYLNFEGVALTASSNNENATQNISYLVSQAHSPGSTVNIAPFNPNDLSTSQGATRQQIIDYTVDQMRQSHSAYNIQFTTTRPTSGVYSMIVFGGTCGSVMGQNCAGIAMLDCGDMVNSNIVFAFPAGLRAQDLAATASQEMAHAFGLSHTTDTTDIMYPFIQNSTPTSYGAGPIPQMDQGSACGGASYQDSDERMSTIIGFPGQDTSPPSVLITNPSNGQTVKIGDPVEANITDDGQITKVELLLNSAVVDTKSAPPYSFSIPATTPFGQVAIQVRATDAAGNDSMHRVTVYVGTGSEEPCQNGTCDDGFECVEDLCYPTDPISTGALGDLCGGSVDCDSGVCAEAQGEMRCSQSCSADNLCPDGFECISDTACWPIEPKSDSGGCELAGTNHGALGGLGLFFMALLLARKPRRRHS